VWVTTSPRHRQGVPRFAIAYALVPFEIEHQKRAIRIYNTGVRQP
jgi:hypothetical protein